MENSVIAIVVSYNGEKDLANTIDSLYGQVNDILIIDNGSKKDTLDVIKFITNKYQIRSINLPDNLGLGRALNIGLEEAISKKYDWVLTMDQDSIAFPSMVQEMLKSALNSKDELCMVTPSILLNLDSKPQYSEDHFVTYAITSGNLVPLKAYQYIGLYNKEYFIDSVDFEFCLRAKLNGIKIIKSINAKLDHKLGNIVERKFYSLRWKYIEHSPLRRYYIYRNHCYLLRDYFFSCPKFLIKKTFNLGLYTLKILINDTSRLSNFRMIILGIFDFIKKRDGKKY